MIIQRININELHPDPANARKHDDKNLKAIKGSLAKFGQQKPIVVSASRVVIAGNGTLEAAKALGWTEIDVVETDLSGAEAIAFALADNRTAELAAWDDDILGKALHALREDGFDIEAIGFDIGDFTNIEEPDYGAVDGDTDIDDLRDGVRKAIQIEFELEHYDEAAELVKFWRGKGAYVGMLLLDKLKSEKAKL